MRIDPDTCRDPDLLAAEVRRLQAAIEELRSAADQADIDYLKEIAQLRLTKAEREAVRWAEHEAQAFWEMGGGSHGFELAATLRGLLTRTTQRSSDPDNNDPGKTKDTTQPRT